MKERVLLRFDTVVAICALLASSVAAGAMVYQTHVIEEQFAATVWPYLGIQSNNTSNSFEIDLTNDGAGPALIRSAQLSVDGKDVSGWNDLLRPVLLDRSVTGIKGKTSASAQSASVNGSTTLRAGDSKSVFALKSANVQVIAVLHKHRIGLKFCYCSINNSCWRLEGLVDTTSAVIPRPVSACVLGAAIQAEPLKLGRHAY